MLEGSLLAFLWTLVIGVLTMGFFDVHCAESGLPLASAGLGTCCIPIARQADKGWAPLALPVRGVYNRLGAIDSIKSDVSTRAFERLQKEMEYPYPLRETGLEGVLQEMNRGVSEDLWVTWGDALVSFMLVDEGMYEAIIETLIRGESGLRHAVDYRAVAARPPEDLICELFPLTDLTSRLYAGLPRDEWESLHEDLVDFVIFRRWGTPIQPINVEQGGQFSHFTPYCFASEDDPEYGPDYGPDYGATKPYVDVARSKYAGFSRLLDAVDANEQYWRDLEREELAD